MGSKISFCLLSIYEGYIQKVELNVLREIYRLNFEYNVECTVDRSNIECSQQYIKLISLRGRGGRPTFNENMERDLYLAN